MNLHKNGYFHSHKFFKNIKWHINKINCFLFVLLLLQYKPMLFIEPLIYKDLYKYFTKPLITVILYGNVVRGEILKAFLFFIGTTAGQHLSSKTCH